MRSLVVIGLGGLMLAQVGFSLSALAQMPTGDAIAGKKKAGTCRTCHGLDGLAKIPIAPHIGGEPAQYIANQLTAFRNGERVHEMMSVVAKVLDDQAIADLAAWYASHTATATLPMGVNVMDAPEACVTCHGATGISETEDAPNLAGESVIYIDNQLKAFRQGKRTHHIMTEISADLSDLEIREFADWYAAAKLEITRPE
ncbi:MAG: c-type cytochrome [Roseibium sp.]